MRSILKRFGAAGVVLLVLNEIRGLIVVGMALTALFGAERSASVVAGTLQPACAAQADCTAQPLAVASAQQPQSR